MAEQLNLGGFYEKVSAFVKFNKHVLGSDEKEGKVYYDFGYFFPLEINSYRGDYSHLALNIEIDTAYQYDGSVIKKEPLTPLAFYKLLLDADGKEFPTYKDCPYILGFSSPLWVANWGESGWTIPVGVKQYYDNLIIETAFYEY